jgi:hypothetical protein
VFYECMYFHDISGMKIEKHKALNAMIESLAQNKSQIGVQAVVKFIGPLSKARHCVVLCILCINLYSTTATGCQPNCS